MIYTGNQAVVSLCMTVPLKKISWADIINKRCGKVLKGVQNEAGTCKFDSMIEHMGKKKYVAFICMSRVTLKGKCSSESRVAF